MGRKHSIFSWVPEPKTVLRPTDGGTSRNTPAGVPSPFRVRHALPRPYPASLSQASRRRTTCSRRGRWREGSKSAFRYSSSAAVGGRRGRGRGEAAKNMRDTPSGGGRIKTFRPSVSVLLSALNSPEADDNTRRHVRAAVAEVRTCSVHTNEI